MGEVVEIKHQVIGVDELEQKISKAQQLIAELNELSKDIASSVVEIKLLNDSHSSPSSKLNPEGLSHILKPTYKGRRFGH